MISTATPTGGFHTATARSGRAPSSENVEYRLPCARRGERAHGRCAAAISRHVDVDGATVRTSQPSSDATRRDATRRDAACCRERQMLRRARARHCSADDATARTTKIYLSGPKYKRAFDRMTSSRRRLSLTRSSKRNAEIFDDGERPAGRTDDDRSAVTDGENNKLISHCLCGCSIDLNV